MRNTIVLLLAILSLGLASGPAQADVTKLSPQESQAILHYHLTMPRAKQLISAMDAMSKYFVSLPDGKERMVKWMKMTPAERLAAMQKDAKAMAILKKNGLTAQDYLVGVPTLRMALMAAQGAPRPPMIVSPANLTFARANLAELKPKMDAADGIAARK